MDLTNVGLSIEYQAPRCVIGGNGVNLVIDMDRQIAEPDVRLLKNLLNMFADNFAPPEDGKTFSPRLGCGVGYPLCDKQIDVQATFHDLLAEPFHDLLRSPVTFIVLTLCR